MSSARVEKLGPTYAPVDAEHDALLVALDHVLRLFQAHDKTESALAARLGRPFDAHHKLHESLHRRMLDVKSDLIRHINISDKELFSPPKEPKGTSVIAFGKKVTLHAIHPGLALQGDVTGELVQQHGVRNIQQLIEFAKRHDFNITVGK